MAKPQNKNFRTAWPKAEAPWTRVHADFAGPIEGNYLLILVDAYSGYPEVHLTRDMLSATVVSRLRRTFSQLGVPEQLVSDNGPSFVSEETRSWLERIGCNLVTTPAYHPQSNGLAERFVRTIKEAIRANGMSQAVIDRYLLFFRASVGSTGSSPAELLLGRKLRAPLLSSRSSWAPGESLIYRAGTRTQQATLVCPTGSNTATIKVGPDNFKKAHLDQLQRVRPAADDIRTENHEVVGIPMRDSGDNEDVSGTPGFRATAETPTEPHQSPPDHRPFQETVSQRPGALERQHTASPPTPAIRQSLRLRDKPRVDYKE